MKIVFCKNCKHRPYIEDGIIMPKTDDYDNPDYLCPYVCTGDFFTKFPQDDWFCNFGEESEDILQSEANVQ